MIFLACVLCGVSAVSLGHAQKKAPVDAIRRVDPLSNNLSLAAVKTYRALYPEHQIFQISQTRKGKDFEYELTIFDPKSTTTTGKQSENKDAFVTVLANYKLILKGTGEVIQEQAHPISESAVPKPVKDAVESWRRPAEGRNALTEWIAHQDKGAERLYSIHIILSAIEGYSATLRADGTFVKKSGELKKVPSTSP
jgi:23S rRNA G2069 N7-methylase RlmK/C1962 C5-methylase RlmI